MQGEYVCPYSYYTKTFITQKCTKFTIIYDSIYHLTSVYDGHDMLVAKLKNFNKLVHIKMYRYDISGQI